MGALDRRWGTSCAAVAGLRVKSSEAAIDGAVVGRAVISGDAGRGVPGWPAAVTGLADGCGDPVRDVAIWLAAVIGLTVLSEELVAGC